MQKLFQITIEVNPEVEDSLCEYLASFSPEGLSVENGPEFSYCIKIFFKEIPPHFQTKTLNYLDSLAGFGLNTGKYSVNLSEITADDWENEWKKFYKPLNVGKNILILPCWLEIPPDNQRLVIKLDPGMAFGTGQHPSTRLCLEMAESYLKPSMRVLDIGCGSGILAIYAALIGCQDVVALDNDSLTLPVARQNALLNKLENILWLAGEAQTIKPPGFDLIFLNLTTEIIMKVGENAINLLNNGGYCLFSGIIAADKAKITSFIQEFGLKILEIREEADWIGLVGQKNA